MDRENASPAAERFDLIDEVEAKGDYTFRMVWKHSFAPLIQRVCRAIAPKHLLEGVDLRNTEFNRHPVGSGPFKLVDWTEDDEITLEANREYFQKGRPILDRLVIRSFPDREAALRSLSRGKMDIALNLVASDLLFVVRQRTFRIYAAPGPYYALIFNLNDPMFDDIRVREALDFAIDRESIVVNQLKNYSNVCTSPFGVESWANNPDMVPNSYSIDKAKELLRQAGWEDTDGDGILDKDGEPFEISITVPNISDSLERIAIAIRAQLVRSGIRANLVYSKDSELHSTPFQVILAMINTGTDPDNAYRIWHSGGEETNLASYENMFVDDLLEQGRRTSDMEKRKMIYHKIHKIIHDDYPAIFLASACEFIGSNYRFRNTRFSSLSNFFTTLKDWRIVRVEEEKIYHEHEKKINAQ